MNKNSIKNICILCAGILYSGVFIFQGIKLHTLYTSAVRYRNSITMLNPVTGIRLNELAKHLARLQKTTAEDLQDLPFSAELPEDTAPARISDTVAAIRTLLQTHGIQAERFRISGNEPAESAEFIFRCDVLKFFNFLSEASIQNTTEVTYLSIRANPDSAAADITMRFKK
ncbi:hypothetical protein FACS1894130_08810 [Spirochaetia bacterium]|nr:hypothetical protein FACS1894130_08810 [Spirochaetia bacterium]